MTGDAAAVDRQRARSQLGLSSPGPTDDGSTVTLDRMVKFAFVLSLVGIVLWGCAVVGLVLGLVARRSLADRGLPKRRMVTASIMIGSIPVAVGALAIAAAAVYVAVT